MISKRSTMHRKLLKRAKKREILAFHTFESQHTEEGSITAFLPRTNSLIKPAVCLGEVKERQTGLNFTLLVY